MDSARSTSRASAADLPTPSEVITENPELSLSSLPSRDWEVDVRGLIPTKRWLSNYGLKKNRLDMFHIMPQIGFKHMDGECTLLLCVIRQSL